MNVRTALVAHPHPIVVDGLAAIVAGAGFAVTRAGDAAATAAALRAVPDFAVIAAGFDGAGAAQRRNGARTLIVADVASDDRDGGDTIALTAPVEQLAAAILALTGPAAAPLTPRERDVARLVAAGQRNRLIAATLGISEGTVKMHLHNVYVKLGLESRTQLAMSAGALGTR